MVAASSRPPRRHPKGRVVAFDPPISTAADAETAFGAILAGGRLASRPLTGVICSPTLSSGGAATHMRLIDERVAALEAIVIR
jgi:hypothetical protein